MTPAVVGASVGFVGALAVRRVLAATITGDQPPLSLVLAAVVLLLVTACAGCLLPARRAARLDPLIAMRE
jgi:ABC-type antimicrobial peptide transport system permease subunit